MSSVLTPEGVISQLRAMQSQLDDAVPLAVEQRRQVRQRLREHPKEVIEASINIIGVLDNVSQAIGQPLADVRRLQAESLRWEAAEDAARAFLRGLEGGNLLRRQRLATIAMQVYAISAQLAKDPDNAVLVPQVEEVRRLKSALQRKKKAKAPETAAVTSPNTE